VLLAYQALGAYFGVMAATGMEVCSASGSSIVTDADGDPLPASAQHMHDSCCLPAFGPSPFLAEWKAVHPLRQAPAEPLTLQKFAAQWLAPLSRGPPLLS